MRPIILPDRYRKGDCYLDLPDSLSLRREMPDDACQRNRRLSGISYVMEQAGKTSGTDF